MRYLSCAVVAGLACCSASENSLQKCVFLSEKSIKHIVQCSGEVEEHTCIVNIYSLMTFSSIKKHPDSVWCQSVIANPTPDICRRPELESTRSTRLTALNPDGMRPALDKARRRVQAA